MGYIGDQNLGCKLRTPPPQVGQNGGLGRKVGAQKPVMSIGL